MIPCLEAEWDDELPPGISGDAAGVLPALGGSRQSDSRVSFSYGLQGLRRGRHPIGPLRVQVLDPFGLVFRRHSFGVARTADRPAHAASTCRRWHRAVRAMRVRLVPRRSTSVSATTTSSRAPTCPGDAMKRLHWKATAHRGELMVRQEEQQINPRAGVFLDCEPRTQGTARDSKGVWEHSPTFEWGIVAAASIVHHLARNGYVVAFQTSSPAIDREIADGQDTVEDAMVDLAVLEPDENDHDRAMTPERAAFAILGRIDIPRAQHWVNAVGGARDVHAFVAAGTSAAALDVLDGARWKVVTYRPNDDLAEMWALFDGSTRA